jgi:hypothetical protein
MLLKSTILSTYLLDVKRKSYSPHSFKTVLMGLGRWLTPVILATQEAQIWRIMV